MEEDLIGAQRSATVGFGEVDVTEWNYRVVRTEMPIGSPEDGKVLDIYSVREAFYGATSIEPECLGMTPIGPLGGSLERLIEDHERIGAALKRPVLDNIRFPVTAHNGPVGAYRE